VAVFLVFSMMKMNFLEVLRVRLLVFGVAASLLLCGFLLHAKRHGFAFLMTGFAIILLGASVFAYLYPRVLISSLNPAWDLTVWNASSSAYSLKISSVIALVFIPLVLMYQGWTYWVLRKRIEKTDLNY
jgi:cytochrome d ubiquinol oxidase subunit II